MTTHGDAVLKLKLERLLVRFDGRTEDLGLPILVDGGEGLIDVPLGEFDLNLEVDSKRCLSFQLAIEIEIGANCHDI